MGSNSNITDPISLYVQKNESLSTLTDTLVSKEILQNQSTFLALAKLKKFNSPKPGHYLIKPGMSSNAIINLLRSGNQTPVNLVIHEINNLNDLSGLLGKTLMADSTEFLSYLSSNDSLKPYNFTSTTIPCMLLPNTYEFYWTASPEKFLNKMQKAYKQYWTEERIAMAKKQKLSPLEVCILASISQKETAKKDEAGKVAGVYMNRLRIGMALQADPTLIYALQDNTIKRVRSKHMQIDSPYNTYKYPGLPPGPIDLPQAYVQNAILDYKGHKYLYFCAKEDFSGYHNFAKSYDIHMINARKYQRALNKKKIYK